MHYGISGQRWGYRRFQNEDGTLTEEGKLRYSHASENADSEHARIKNSFEKANRDCWRDQNLLRNWSTAYPSFEAKLPSLVEKYNNAYQKDGKIQSIQQQMDTLVKDYWKTNEVTNITLYDILFRKEAAQKKRDAMLNGLTSTYKELYKRRDDECYCIAYDTFKDLPKFERTIAMGTFQPFEHPYKEIRKRKMLAF